MEQTPASPAKILKCSSFRCIIGNSLIFLIIAFTIYLSINMVHRIHSVVLKDTYKKVFRYELLLCGIMFFCALDFRTGFLTCVPFLPAKVIGWGLRVVLNGASAAVLVLAGDIIYNGSHPNPGDADHVLVLGLALQNGKPTKDLLLRMKTAKAYAEQNPDAVLVLTGGNPDESGRTEAEVMRGLLTKAGVPEERLILEDKAADTEENFRNAAELIDPSEPVLVISSDYHMSRAMQLASDAGFRQAIRLPAPSDPVQYGTNVMWEIVVKVNMLISKVKG